MSALATCGTCGLTWDDSIATGYTPAPSGRCPFEAFHKRRELRHIDIPASFPVRPVHSRADWKNDPRVIAADAVLAQASDIEAAQCQRAAQIHAAVIAAALKASTEYQRACADYATARQNTQAARETRSAAIRAARDGAPNPTNQPGQE